MPGYNEATVTRVGDLEAYRDALTRLTAYENEPITATPLVEDCGPVDGFRTVAWQVSGMGITVTAGYRETAYKRWLAQLAFPRIR